MTSATDRLVFAPLGSGLRKSLEQVVVEARDVVEAGVGKVVVGRLGVGERRSPTGLADDEKVLRRALVAKRRQAGSMEAVVEEVAFGLWHRMLFARFLAENNLLIHPTHNVPVSLAECTELAEAEGLADGWMVASRFASNMLPGLFPQDDPLAQLQLLPEDLAALEGLLEGLDREVFTSDDGLGWVYQFWQSKRKDEVNASEVKIGARELPAVTQLFTEHYMVRFLLENSLGAWWAARHPDSPLIEAFEYLRFADDGKPAAGSFDMWPDTAAEVTVMDPCCGSGHFLTTAFEMLWRMRAEEEHLDPADAQDAVLRDNLFGLEIDPRCTQIAAFNLALTAWKADDEYRPLPIPNIACSGIRIAGSLEDWQNLAGDDARLQTGLEHLHAQFKDADTLGSLINPRQSTEEDTLLSVDYEQLEPLLHQALQRETPDDPTAAIFGHQAQAITKAATLLSHQYTLVTTNPPFLFLGRGVEVLSSFAADAFDRSNTNLSTVTIERSLLSLVDGGSLAMVSPEDWLFLTSYQSMRRHTLETTRLNLVVGLGTGAFTTSAIGSRVRVTILILSNQRPAITHNWSSLDLNNGSGPEGKSRLAQEVRIQTRSQADLLEGPDARILLDPIAQGTPLLGDYASGIHGLGTKDSLRFIRSYWEVPENGVDWEFMQSTVTETRPWGGLSSIVYWQQRRGVLHELGKTGDAILVGSAAYGRPGVVVSQTGELSCSLYWGGHFFKNAAVVSPNDPLLMKALWAFCASPDYNQSVRAVDQSLKVTNRTLVKVPFDVEYWREVAEEEFPDGLPEPYSDDPTQWLFLGEPTDTTRPLQVAVARLLGYSWPDQQPDDLDALADEDGIVCLPPVLGEQFAAQRLQDLLIRAFQPDNPTQLINQLLADEDAEGKTLEEWLRDLFFKQHCKLFHNRPFIWHITDGSRDGFSALVNYHKLDRDTLKRLTNTYLKWWIDRQQAQIRSEEPGAEARLAAAEELRVKLELILEGEPPNDIYVRWKPLSDQPIGWDPDLNDGIRLNLRPFVETEVLRSKLNVKWGKDRGKNPDGTERHNNLHPTRQQKHDARKETT